MRSECGTGSNQDTESTSRVITNLVIGIARGTDQCKNLIARLTSITHCIARDPAVLDGGRGLQHSQQLSLMLESPLANGQLKEPGRRVLYERVALRIVLLRSPTALAHGCFKCVIKTIVKVHDIRREALGTLRFWMKDEALIRCAREADKEEPVPFLIATDSSHVRWLFADHVNYGPAYLAFRDIRVFVTVVHR